MLSPRERASPAPLADGSGRFRLGRDVVDLVGAAGTNVLTVKLSYWLGR